MFALSNELMIVTSSPFYCFSADHFSEDGQVDSINVVVGLFWLFALI